MPRIIPIRDLKDTASISKHVEESKEPIFVTKNGYGCMVLMSMSLYEEISGKEMFMKKKEEKKSVSYIAEDTTKYNK